MHVIHSAMYILKFQAILTIGSVIIILVMRNINQGQRVVQEEETLINVAIAKEKVQLRKGTFQSFSGTKAQRRTEKMVGMDSRRLKERRPWKLNVGSRLELSDPRVPVGLD